MNYKSLSVILAIGLIVCLAFAIYQTSNNGSLKKEKEQFIAEKNELDHQISDLNTAVQELKTSNTALQAQVTEATDTNRTLTENDQNVLQIIDSSIKQMKHQEMMMIK